MIARAFCGMLRICFVSALFGLPLIGPTYAEAAAEEVPDPTSIETRYAAAEALRKGVGGVVDLPRALAIYTELAALGNSNAYRRIGEIHLKLGRETEALVALETAVELGNKSAMVKLAEGHARGQFGPLSDAEQGFPRLVELYRTLGSRNAKYALARAYSEGYGTTPDHAKALEMFRDLAAEGHGSSYRQLGDYYAEGIHVAQDLDAAIAAYRAAIDAGNMSAIRSVARVQIAANRFEDAAKTLEDAVNLETPGMAYWRAVYHAEERLGDMSDRRLGLAELRRLSNAGDARAAAKTLKLAEKPPHTFEPADIQAWVAVLEEAAADGDGRATEALARAYRSLGRWVPDAQNKHKALVSQLGHQMRPRYRTTETLHAVYSPSRARTLWSEMVRLVTEAKDDGYYYGALELRKIDKNAYTYLLQTEMRRMGCYSGRMNGLMTRSTLRAILRFCRGRGDQQLCEIGPLKSDPTKFIMKELLQLRTASAQQQEGVIAVHQFNSATADVGSVCHATPGRHAYAAVRDSRTAEAARRETLPRNTDLANSASPTVRRTRGGFGARRVVGVFDTPRDSWILVQGARGDIVEVRVDQELDGVRVSAIDGNSVTIRTQDRVVALNAGDWLPTFAE